MFPRPGPGKYYNYDIFPVFLSFGPVNTKSLTLRTTVLNKERMKYAGEFRGKALVFLGMVLLAAYIAFKACEPIPGTVPMHSTKHSLRPA